MTDTFWATIFERERLSERESFKSRLAISVRLVRELALIKGLVGEDQLLMDSMVLQKYWYMPVTYFTPYSPGPAMIRRMNVPLCPPKTKSFADPLMMDWIAVMQVMAHRIGAYKSDTGLKGMFRLLDPPHSQSIFPEPEEIMSFEHYHVEEVLQVQVKSGILKSMESLLEEGYSTNEAKREISLAKSLAPAITAATLEQDKAIMTLRVEDLIERAKVSADIRAELQGLKLLTFVKGLHHVKSSDMMDELVKVMTETGKKFEIENKPQGITIEPERKELEAPESED